MGVSKIRMKEGKTYLYLYLSIFVCIRKYVCFSMQVNETFSLSEGQGWTFLLKKMLLLGQLLVLKKFHLADICRKILA